MRGTPYTIEIAGSDPISFIFEKLAHQASASVIVKQGETVVHVAATAGEMERPELDFVPLTVDYEERFYARGAILGSRFVRREGKPSDEAILTARAIDRAIRPLFPHTLRRDIQVVALTLALDEKHEPGLLALLGASLALATSPIPWNGPLYATRLAKKGTAWITDPSYQESGAFDAELLIAGTDAGISMIEAEGKEFSEADLEEALGMAEKIGASELAALAKIIEKEKQKKCVLADETYPSSLAALYTQKYASSIDRILQQQKEPLLQKTALSEARKSFLAEARTTIKGGEGVRASSLWEESLENAFEKLVGSGHRVDGRRNNELRTLSAEAGGFSTVLHGSGTFYRGDTHVATFLTLGSDLDSLTTSGMEVSGEQHFIHQYNFPPYAGGETGRLAPNRRAIGHGALAEKALRAVLPPRAAFPRTIRLVSEVFASNGSTSMASVCAGSVALENGQVPITRPVAGIAMGLATQADGTTLVLTDIQGIEDHYGEMDYKVAGTGQGITALQLDIKRRGVPKSMIIAATRQARIAHSEIIPILVQAGKTRSDAKRK